LNHEAQPYTNKEDSLRTNQPLAIELLPGRLFDTPMGLKTRVLEKRPDEEDTRILKIRKAFSSPTINPSVFPLPLTYPYLE
jgi:hypothetical protein